MSCLEGRSRRFWYCRARDAYVGDGSGLASGWVDFERDELEVGGRAAMGLDDVEQTWWELEELRRRCVAGPSR